MNKDTEKTKEELITELRTLREHMLADTACITTLRKENERLAREIEARDHSIDALTEEHHHLDVALKRLTSIVSAVPVPLFYKDRKGYYIGVNDAFAEFMGHPPEYYAGKTVMEVNPSEYAEVYHNKDLELMGHPRKQVYEFAALDKDGIAHPVILSKQVFWDEEGRVAGIAGTFQDITDRVSAEQALRESEATLKSIFLAAPIGVGLVVDNTFVRVNEWFCMMSGYSSQEMLGQNIRMLFPDENEFERVIQEKRRQMREHNAGTVETRLQRKDRAIIDILLSAAPLDREHWGRGVSFIALDISARKQAEVNMLQTKQEFESIFDNSDVGIALFKSGRFISRGNRRMAEILGYESPEYLVGMSSRELHLDEKHYADFGERFYQSLARGEQTRVEYQLRKKDGKPVWCSLSGKALDTSNLNKGVIWVIDDLTQRKTLETSLITAKETAEAASRAKSQFLDNMSHELRTPLNGIVGMLQILEATTLDAEQQDFVESATLSARRLTRLLSDILVLSRMDARRLQIIMEAFDLRDTMHTVVQLFHSAAKEKNLELILRMETDQPLRVKGDAVRLQQVLINMIGNAIKFTEKGHVEVNVQFRGKDEEDKCRLLFSVADTGIGISADILDQLFAPFAQAEESHTRSYQGAGLGLTISRQLIVLMGGAMTVESVPNVGSTFRFCLPWEPEDTAPLEILDNKS